MSKKTLSENPYIAVLSVLKKAVSKKLVKLHFSMGNEKMGFIPFISISAGCNKMTRSDGVIVRDFEGSCKGCGENCEPGCYATNSETQYDDVRKNRAENFVLAKYDLPEFKNQCNEYFKYFIFRFFRIHEGGEFFSYEYFLTWCDIARENPGITFYCYTKRFMWVRRAEDLHVIPENLIINLSATTTNKSVIRKMFPEKKFKLFIWDESNLKTSENIPESCEHCPAVGFNGKKTGTKCDHCLKCAMSGEITGDIAVYDHSKRSHKK